MAKRELPQTVADEVLESPQESVLDVIDHLLNKGVMLNGDVTLGVAGVDLVYLRLGALLAAADRVLPGFERGGPPARRRKRQARPPLLRRRRGAS